MKLLKCEQCGANEFFEVPGYRICKYCHARYVIEKKDLPEKESTIAVSDDVSALLEKCRKDPVNARKYANLILDIDPTNKEAKKYL